jgi:hypothetical protein
MVRVPSLVLVSHGVDIDGRNGPALAPVEQMF